MSLSTAFILSLLFYCATAANTTRTPTPVTTMTPPPHLKFKCAANGFITDISGVDKADVVILNGTNYCHLNESGCDWQNQATLNVLHVKGEKSSEIAGGKNAHFYQLECKTAGSFVATVKSKIQMEIPLPTDYTHEVIQATNPTSAITLTITTPNGTQASKVQIGDLLLLQITGPVGYTIEPISCNASSSMNTDYALWTNEACSSKDTAVIEDTWHQNKTINNLISIPMYGFRFVGSDTVTVTCSAMFCPKGLPCSSKHCVDIKPKSIGRRRRNAGVETDSDNGLIEESFSTYFTVVDNKIDANGCSGVVVSIFTFVTAFALMLALK